MEKLTKPRSKAPETACSVPVPSGAPTRSGTGQYLPGTSGNPKGRPPDPMKQSFAHATQIVRALLEENASGLAQAVIAQALKGNPVAQKLCLERLAPPVPHRTVQFDLAAKPLTKIQTERTAARILAEHNAVLQSVASGNLTPQEGQAISTILDSRRRSWESAHLADCITTLEVLADGSKRTPQTPTVRWFDEVRDDSAEAEADAKYAAERDSDEADEAGDDADDQDNPQRDVDEHDVGTERDEYPRAPPTREPRP